MYMLVAMKKRFKNTMLIVNNESDPLKWKFEVVGASLYAAESLKSSISAGNLKYLMRLQFFLLF